MSGVAMLAQRFTRLKEISGIMTAMKSLSLVETRKLARRIGYQRSMLDNIETAARDFLNFFPAADVGELRSAIVLVIGSERGFCGNFNERILAALEALPSFNHVSHLVLVGHRLGTKLEAHPEVIARIEGATVTEEVPGVLDRLMDVLHGMSWMFSGDGVALFGLAHNSGSEPAIKRLLPLAPAQASRRAHAPRLQLAPADFFGGMLNQYLLAAMYGLLYESLAAEYRQRLAHMENALDRLDETIARLALKRNALRQEKIVEEIEVMLTSRQAFVNGR